MLKSSLESQGDHLFRFRGIYLSIIFIIFAFLEVNNSYKIYSSLTFYSGMIISVFGLFIRCITIGYIHDNTSGRNTAEGQVADSLNIFGMYSIVRNPLYLGNFFMSVGVFISLGLSFITLSLSIIIFLYYKRVIYTEEIYLKEKFGDVYNDWLAVTNAIVPNIFKFNRSNLRFSISRVVVREYAGAYLIVLVYTLICYSRLSLYNNFTFFNYYPIFLIIILYLITRLYKKHFL